MKILLIKKKKRKEMAESFLLHKYDVVYIYIFDFGLKFLKPV